MTLLNDHENWAFARGNNGLKVDFVIVAVGVSN